jgi:hypothetical protein
MRMNQRRDAGKVQSAPLATEEGRRGIFIASPAQRVAIRVDPSQ